MITMASRITKEHRALFSPDLHVADVFAVDLDALRGAGIRALLLDMDNTISPHHSAEVVPGMPEWLAALPSAGFGVRFVSNNWHADITERAGALGFPVIARAMKPLPFAFRAAARDLGVTVSECAVIGDQIFTDVLGGNLAGAMTILVEPLTLVDLPHTRVLRRLERAIMSRRTPESHRSEGEV